MEKPPREGERQRSSLSAIINKRIRDGVIEKNPKRDRKPQQKNELDRRLRSICTELDEGNVKAGIRIAVGNTFHRLSAKCAGYHVFESRQARYGNRQVGVGTKRGAELALHVVCRCLIESPLPKENVILKIDFVNAFNSINRQFMLEKVFEIHPEVYNYSHSAYSQPTFLFYGDSVIKSCEGTQQGDPVSPALFSDSIQDLIDSLESKTKLMVP